MRVVPVEGRARLLRRRWGWELISPTPWGAQHLFLVPGRTRLCLPSRPGRRSVYSLVLGRVDLVAGSEPRPWAIGADVEVHPGAFLTVVARADSLLLGIISSLGAELQAEHPNQHRRLRPRRGRTDGRFDEKPLRRLP